MKLVDTAVRRPVTVAMGAVTLLLFGAIALSDLAVNLLPDLSYPTLTVRTEFEGAAPEEIETLLTRPIEEAVGVVNGVREVNSISRPGQSDVVLEFAWGSDMDSAGLDVREKLEVLQLPLDATRPQLLRFNPATDPIMRMGLSYGERAAGDAAELKALRRFADEELKKRLEPVAGVAAVKISGGLEDEIHIDIDERKLAQLGLSVGEVAGRLQAENVNLSAGRLEDGTRRYLVRTINQYQSVQEIADTVVETTDGRPVYLDDVANVYQGHKERQAIIRMNGGEAVEIAVYKEGDANTVAVASAVSAAVDELRNDLPEGMQILTVDDQSRFIRQAVGEVVNAALLGGILAMLIIFAFLRQLSATFIVAVAIPISIVATFFLMGQAGVSLNVMSLGGIALAVGLLVDNAIVVLENIARHRAEGASNFEAAKNGASEVGGAVVAATLTTIAVFLPLAFVEGIAGQLFRDQALTVTFALAVSLLAAITVIPTMAARLSRDPGDRGGNAESGGRIIGALRDRYTALLRGALNHRAAVLGSALALFALAVWSLSRMELELVPQLAQGRFEVAMEMTPGTPLARTDNALARVQSRAEALEAVDLVYGVSGSGNRIDANPTQSGENIGRMLVTLTDSGAATEREAMTAVRRAVREQAGAEANLSRPRLMSFDKPLEIQVTGYELGGLKATAREVVRRLETSDRFVDIESSAERGQPEIQIRFDQERAAALGLTVKQISDQIVSTVRGEVASRYSWRDRKIDILVRAPQAERSSIEDIRGLLINPQSRRAVPLSAVATVSVSEGPAEIRRANQERVAVISANIAYGALSAGVEEARSLLQGLNPEPGQSVRLAGQNDELQASTRSLVFALGLASQFESLVQPLVILFSIPLAAVGVALGLSVAGIPISVMALIGTIMLAGIVVNNAIVLLDLINHLRARGMERIEAIVEGGRLRLRPILMTTLTTTFGLLPMALGLGEGAELRTPMAVTVISGLLVSTLLTLVVVPVVYSLLDRRAAPRVSDAVIVEGSRA